jgi:putative sterol carrier protein
MDTEFPTVEWFEELQTRLNEDDTYGEQAAGYGVDFNGDYLFTIDPDDGLSERHHYYVGLEDGDCTEVYAVDSPAEADTGFELSGDYSSWKELVRGRMGAIEGIMSGEFELDGDMNTLMQYQDAAATLVEHCAEIESDFV